MLATEHERATTKNLKFGGLIFQQSYFKYNINLSKIKSFLISELYKNKKHSELIILDSLKVFKLDDGKGLLVEIKLKNGKLDSTSASYSSFAVDNNELTNIMAFNLIHSLYYSLFQENYIDTLK